jgi:hypothetical protein
VPAQNVGLMWRYGGRRVLYDVFILPQYVAPPALGGFCGCQRKYRIPAPALGGRDPDNRAAGPFQVL